MAVLGLVCQGAEHLECSIKSVGAVDTPCFLPSGLMHSCLGTRLPTGWKWRERLTLCKSTRLNIWAQLPVRCCIFTPLKIQRRIVTQAICCCCNCISQQAFKGLEKSWRKAEPSILLGDPKSGWAGGLCLHTEGLETGDHLQSLQVARLGNRSLIFLKDKGVLYLPCTHRSLCWPPGLPDFRPSHIFFPSSFCQAAAASRGWLNRVS